MLAAAEALLYVPLNFEEIVIVITSYPSSNAFLKTSANVPIDG